MELTIEGKPNPNIKIGRVGQLTGPITAIKETPSMLKLDRPGEKQLLISTLILILHTQLFLREVKITLKV